MSSFKVGIVEDSIIARNFLSEAIEREGWKTVESTHPGELCSQQHEDIKVILVDMDTASGVRHMSDVLKELEKCGLSHAPVLPFFGNDANGIKTARRFNLLLTQGDRSPSLSQSLQQVLNLGGDKSDVRN